MRTLSLILSIGVLAAVAALATAQRPGGGPGGPPDGPGGPGGFGGGLSKSADVDDLVSRMMAFDQDKDGKLTRGEVTDERLLGLFDRADADKDGTVTKAELTALAEKEYVAGGGGFGGPGGPPPGGPGGGPGGFGGPPSRPGEVLSAMLQQRLGLTSAQKGQIAELQAEVESKLEKILDDDQKKQLQQMRERGSGGPGGPGGGPRRGGPGGPGGGPPSGRPQG